MTRNGARGRTATEMDQVLHAPHLQQLNEGLSAIEALLERHSRRMQLADGSVAEVALRVANSLWGQQALAWEPAFLEALRGRVRRRDARGRLSRRCGARRVRSTRGPVADPRQDRETDTAARARRMSAWSWSTPCRGAMGQTVRTVPEPGPLPFIVALTAPPLPCRRW